MSCVSGVSRVSVACVSVSRVLVYRMCLSCVSVCQCVNVSRVSCVSCVSSVSRVSVACVSVSRVSVCRVCLSCESVCRACQCVACAMHGVSK